MNLLKRIRTAVSLFIDTVIKTLESYSDEIEELTRIQLLSGRTFRECRAIVDMLDERFLEPREEIMKILYNFISIGGDVGQIIERINKAPFSYYKENKVRFSHLIIRLHNEN